MEHLAEQKEVAKEREKELDEMVNAEVERQYKQKLNHWRKEKEARKKLMNDVIETRRKQIQDKSELD